MQSLILFLGVYFTYFLFDRLNFTLSPHGGKFLGDHRRGVPPVPIPNTAVKPSAANGSWTLGPARVGRCQVYSPDLLKKVRASFLLIPVASQGVRNSITGYKDGGDDHDSLARVDCAAGLRIGIRAIAAPEVSALASEPIERVASVSWRRARNTVCPR